MRNCVAQGFGRSDWTSGRRESHLQSVRPRLMAVSPALCQRRLALKLGRILLDKGPLDSSETLWVPHLDSSGLLGPTNATFHSLTWDDARSFPRIALLNPE